MIKRATIITVLLFLSMEVRAEEKMEVEEIVEMSLEDILNIEIDVSSSQSDDIFHTPSTVSIIDRTMIQQYNFTTISEVLNIVGGFKVQRNYIKRNIPTARGILQENYANKILYLVDGIASWHAVTGEPNVDRIDINDVERIEILKGPASVLYGTNAYAGAVNIVLKKSKDEDVKISMHAGDRHSFKGGGRYSFTNDKMSFFVSGYSSDERGYDQIFTDEVGEAGHMREYLKGSNLTLKTIYGPHKLFFNGFSFHESFLGTLPRFSDGAGKDHIGGGYLLNYTYDKLFRERFDIKAGATYDWNERNSSRSRDDLTRTNTKGYRMAGFAHSNVSLSDAFAFETGFDYEYRNSFEYATYNVLSDATTDANNMADKNLYEYSVVGQLKYSKDPFGFIIGTRYTDNELFGSNVSSRGTLLYALNKRNSLKVIIGQSYRAPSFFELYFTPGSKTVFGNPELEPEKSNSYEIAYLTSFRNLFVQLLGYYATYDDKIFRIRTDIERDGVLYRNVNAYSNGNEFSAKGLELEMKYNLPNDMNAFINYNMIDGDSGDEVNNDGHYNFKYVPKNYLSAGLAKNIRDYFFSVLMNMYGETMGPLERIDTQYSFDVNLGYSHKFASTILQHTISAKNLFNEEIMFPEYVRRGGLNAVPDGLRRRIYYTLRIYL